MLEKLSDSMLEKLSDMQYRQIFLENLAKQNIVPLLDAYTLSEAEG